MEFNKIILFILIVILFIILISYISKDAKNLSDLTSGETEQTISSDDLPEGDSSINFTYSIWFYIDDWNYKYSEVKTLYERISGSGSSRNVCPSVTFDRAINNLNVLVSVYPNEESSQTPTLHSCSIPNIPLQKWCNFLLTSYGRTMDLYLDGKLVKTCLMDGVPKIVPGSSVKITPNGGFSGWTSSFKYWPEAVNPQKAWDIYKEGYGGSWLGNLFGKYSLKISVVEGDTEETSITI
jgi:hypothetical protein